MSDTEQNDRDEKDADNILGRMTKLIHEGSIEDFTDLAKSITYHTKTSDDFKTDTRYEQIADETSDTLEKMVKEYLTEDYIDVVNSIIYCTIMVKIDHDTKSSRSEVSKQISIINKLSSELIYILSNMAPEVKNILHTSFFYEEIKYKGRFHPEKNVNFMGEEIKYFSHLSERLIDDLKWINSATDIPFSARGSWPKDYISYLILELSFSL